MKIEIMKIFTFGLLQFLMIFQLSAQNRYLDEIFSDIEVTSDIVYGKNATILSDQSLGNLHRIDLLLDFYQPLEDTISDRPLVLVFHDGQFLPQVINGRIIGSKKDSSIQEICNQLAKRGFTAAAVSYRLGWNPLASSQTELAIGLIQALYRGVQDGQTAVRFFNNSYAESNPYGIDPDKIVVWGNGTGGLISMNMLAISDANDLLYTTYPAGKFIYDDDGDGIPESPMILEEIHGDAEGKYLTIAPYTMLNINAGDTTNYENYPDMNSDFHLAVNISGALADLGWVKQNEIPSISFHSKFDIIYPYDEYTLFVHPGTQIFALQGSKLFAEVQDSLGNNQAWKDGLLSTDLYSEQAKLNSEKAGHSYFEGLYPFVNDVNSFGNHEGITIDWWDPEGSSPIDGLGKGLPWNELIYPGTTMTFHEIELLTNENMSASKARANIDTIMNYFAPRACLTLNLSECSGAIFSSTEKESIKDEIVVYPNPARSQFSIHTGNNKIEKIRIFNNNGAELKNYIEFVKNKKSFNLPQLNPGMYFLQIETSDGVLTKKIVLE